MTESRDGLWIASTYSGEIQLVDPSNGATLTAFPTSGGAKTGAHGLESRNGKLWVVVPSSRTIYRVDENFDLIHQIPAPGNRPHGIAWEGNDLWCAETGLRSIFRLNPQNGGILEKIDTPERWPEPHGMTIWDGCIWYCDAGSGAVCRFPYY